jgi:integrase
MSQRNRSLARLTAVAVKNAKEPGVYQDGGGLRLVVTPAKTRQWVIRITVNGKRRDVGLGGYPAVSLDRARTLAAVHRTTAKTGGDPIEQRRIEKAKARTYKEAFEDYFVTKKKELTNGSHMREWESCMERYVFPKIGERPVGEVRAGEIVDILRPIWDVRAETARRVLQRMTAVFDAEIVLENRERANPCTGVARVLGASSREKGKFRSLPYGQIGTFVKALRLRAGDPATKLCLEWLILTAARSGEARGTAWAEIDEKQALWILPPERMKGRREHVVPLSGRCLEIVKEARALGRVGALLFPSQRSGEMLSDMTLTKLLRDMDYAEVATVHGFRSTFKTWCGEMDKVRDEVSEAALAHQDGNAVRAAYLRAQYLEERKDLMRRWKTFVLA